jgi:hypothetical protein
MHACFIPQAGLFSGDSDRLSARDRGILSGRPVRGCYVIILAQIEIGRTSYVTINTVTTYRHVEGVALGKD